MKKLFFCLGIGFVGLLSPSLEGLMAAEPLHAQEKEGSSVLEGDSERQSSRPSPQEALARLLKGNDRYQKDQLEHPQRTSDRREALESHQEPFATIVGCSDSRVSPEILFDQGIGDLFVVRVAGNVIGEIELDSIQYAALYLHTSVILVLGHERCGAVDAVIQGTTKQIQTIARLIAPSVEKVDQEEVPHLLEDSTKLNAVHWRDFLLQSPVIQQLVQAGKLQVHAGYYHLSTGLVEIL